MKPGAEHVETTLAIVRHGESAGNLERSFGGHGPTPLTELGHAQARATAAILTDGFAPTALVSSDLPRAAQTAEHVADATGLTVQTTPDLRERGLGRLDGLPFREAKERYPDDWRRLLSRDPDWACPGGGEATRAVLARVGRAIDDIVAGHPGGRVVVVSHGVAIHLAFAHICGIDPLGPTPRVYVHVDNCSITRVTYRSEGVWRIDALNDTHHLDRYERVDECSSQPHPRTRPRHVDG